MDEKRTVGGERQKGSRPMADRNADAIDRKLGAELEEVLEYCVYRDAVSVARTVVSDASMFIVEQVGHPIVAHHSPSSLMRQVSQTKPSLASPRKASSKSSGLVEHSAVAAATTARW